MRGLPDNYYATAASPCGVFRTHVCVTNKFYLRTRIIYGEKRTAVPVLDNEGSVCRVCHRVRKPCDISLHRNRDIIDR